MSYSSFRSLTKSFESLGCSEILIKYLAVNQDNEKNQIYLGYSLELLSILPGKVSFRTPSESKNKSGSNAGQPIVEHAMEFYWIEDGMAPAIAPFIVR